jgi:hypothetical protein
MKVYIPFLPQFEKPMLNGTKTMTSRSKRYGEPNDIFEKFGATFQILSVEKMSLGDIQKFWKEEGLNSPEHFMLIWKQIHPYRVFNPTDKFFVHRFKKVNVT